MENSMGGPSKKLCRELSYDVIIPLLGSFLKTVNSLFQKDICIPMFIAMVFTVARTWKQVSLNRWMDKENVMYVCIYIIQILLSCEKKKIMPFEEIILKDDAVKVLHTICQQIWKTAVATRLEKVHFHPNPKEKQRQTMFKLLHNCTHLTC